MAATASAGGKTALLFDPSPFFGSHYASLSFPELELFLDSNSKQPSLGATAVNGYDYLIVSLTTRPVYSDVEISCFSPKLLEGT
ncbi:unnamed protein product [Dovyalis caffra]|uniref:Uncharacterized protein n=1 Tax=Dovyalis caffra TaxID=77055 RepID=A0AAV1SRV6_9ROSI|nr:unnamed protein product [Dovyalis caffra]